MGMGAPSNRPTYSVIVPLYNSADVVERLYGDIEKVCRDCDESWEVVFVDDGSSDTTAAALGRLVHDDELRLRAVYHPENRGQHEALRSGLLASSGTIAITLDDDYEISPAAITTLMQTHHRTGAGLVYGVSNNKSYSVAAWRWGSRILQQLQRWALHNEVRASACRLFLVDAPLLRLVGHCPRIFLDVILLLYFPKRTTVLLDGDEATIPTRYTWSKKFRQVVAIGITWWWARRFIRRS